MVLPTAIVITYDCIMDHHVASIAHSILSSFDYHTALDFVGKYGNQLTYNLLQRLPITSFSQEKLIAELERLSEGYQPDRFIGESTATATTTPTTQARTATASHKKPLTPEDQHLIQQRNDLVRQLDHYRGQLRYIPTDEERLEVALRILDMEDELRDTWRKINYYRKHQCLPPDPPKDELQKVFYETATSADYLRIRNNYRTYLAKAKAGKKPKEKIPFYESVIVEAERRMHEN